MDAATTGRYRRQEKTRVTMSSWMASWTAKKMAPPEEPTARELMVTEWTAGEWTAGQWTAGEWTAAEWAAAEWAEPPVRTEARARVGRTQPPTARRMGRQPTWPARPPCSSGRWAWPS